MGKNQEQPIIWAIDPLYTKLKNGNRLTQIISAWIQDENTVVEPVFVLNDISEKKSWAHEDANKVLTEATSNVKSIKNLKSPKIIRTVKPPYTNRKLVRAMAEYAEKVNAELIAIQSSDKGSVARIILGSFAESLILKSKFPVLLLPNKAKSIRKIEKIVFATDFSKDSAAAYKKILSKAEKLKAKVYLYHKSEFGVEVRSKDWKTIENSFDVEVTHKVAKNNKSKSISIIDFAKEIKSDLIAMAPRTGKIEGMLLGTATLQVARTSMLPLLIQHTK